MEIVSLTFLAFTAVVLFVYYWLPHHWQNAWLLMASFAFYVTWAWQLALILALHIALNYWIAQRITASDTPSNWLRAGVGFNIILVLFVKYQGFYLDVLASTLGITLSDSVKVFSSVGLSFLMLQGIAYLIDVNRGRVSAEKNLVDFALFLAFFPKLTSGPIENARAFLPAIKAPRLVDNNTINEALSLIVMGLVRKVIIADTMFGRLGDVPSAEIASLSAVVLWGRLLVYSFAIYNDFAGYTSLIRGVALLFGFQLSKNFQQPYTARTFAEFWAAWHISFSRWLRDYIYLPVNRYLLSRGSTRTSPVTLIVPPLITMSLSGLWHTVSFNMLLWGGLHAVYQMFEGLPRIMQRRVVPPDKRPVWHQWLMRGTVFLGVMLAWIPFQYDVSTSMTYMRGLFAIVDGTSVLVGLRYIVALVPTLVLDTIQTRTGKDLFFMEWHWLWKSLGLALVLLLTVLTSLNDYTDSTFIYQGF